MRFNKSNPIEMFFAWTLTSTRPAAMFGISDRVRRSHTPTSPVKHRPSLLRKEPLKTLTKATSAADLDTEQKPSIFRRISNSFSLRSRFGSKAAESLQDPASLTPEPRYDQAGYSLLQDAIGRSFGVANIHDMRERFAALSRPSSSVVEHTSSPSETGQDESEDYFRNEDILSIGDPAPELPEVRYSNSPRPLPPTPMDAEKASTSTTTDQDDLDYEDTQLVICSATEMPEFLYSGSPRSLPPTPPRAWPPTSDAEDASASSSIDLDNIHNDEDTQSVIDPRELSDILHSDPLRPLPAIPRARPLTLIPAMPFANNRMDFTDEESVQGTPPSMRIGSWTAQQARHASLQQDMMLQGNPEKFPFKDVRKKPVLVEVHEGSFAQSQCAEICEATPPCSPSAIGSPGFNPWATTTPVHSPPKLAPTETSDEAPDVSPVKPRIWEPSTFVRSPTPTVAEESFIHHSLMPTPLFGRTKQPRHRSLSISSRRHSLFQIYEDASAGNSGELGSGYYSFLEGTPPRSSDGSLSKSPSDREGSDHHEADGGYDGASEGSSRSETTQDEHDDTAHTQATEEDILSFQVSPSPSPPATMTLIQELIATSDQMAKGINTLDQTLAREQEEEHPHALLDSYPLLIDIVGGLGERQNHIQHILATLGEKMLATEQNLYFLLKHNNGFEIQGRMDEMEKQNAANFGALTDRMEQMMKMMLTMTGATNVQPIGFEALDSPIATPTHRPRQARRPLPPTPRMVLGEVDTNSPRMPCTSTKKVQQEESMVAAEEFGELAKGLRGRQNLYAGVDVRDFAYADGHGHDRRGFSKD